MSFKKYYELAKPGIIYGNLLTAVAAFFLASKGAVNWLLLVEMAVGTSLVIGSACVFNNCIDRDMDAKMERTKNRSTVTGEIGLRAALAYGIVLLILGSSLLYFYTNILTVTVALIGVVSYVGLYTPAKRRTIYSTLIGSIPGATPPVIGYCAVTGRFDLAALILFLVLIFWQMPHFYAIAMYRLDQYAAASIPLLPIKKGMRVTKIHIVCYVILFTLAAASLTLLGFAGYSYLVIVLILGLTWLYKGLKGFAQADSTFWGKKMFLFSLIVITVFSLALALNHLLP